MDTSGPCKDAYSFFVQKIKTGQNAFVIVSLTLLLWSECTAMDLHYSDHHRPP